LDVLFEFPASTPEPGFHFEASAFVSCFARNDFGAHFIPFCEDNLCASKHGSALLLNSNIISSRKKLNSLFSHQSESSPVENSQPQMPTETAAAPQVETPISAANAVESSTVADVAMSTADSSDESDDSEDLESEQDDDDYYSASPQTTSPEHSDNESDDDSDDEMLGPLLSGNLEKDRNALANFVMDSDEDDEDGNARPKTKNEISIDEMPPPEPIQHELPADATLEAAGKITSVVGNLVVVTGLANGPALNLESVLWNEDRTPLGRVDDVFGPVAQPIYSIRFADAAAANVFKSKVGSIAFYSASFASFVLKSQLLAMKGSDASSKFDEEPAEHELEFSDDEAEAAHKRNLKLKRQGRAVAAAGNGPAVAQSKPAPRAANRGAPSAAAGNAASAAVPPQFSAPQYSTAAAMHFQSQQQQMWQMQQMWQYQQQMQQFGMAAPQPWMPYAPQVPNYGPPQMYRPGQPMPAQTQPAAAGMTPAQPASSPSGAPVHPWAALNNLQQYQ
jgi:rRNA processing protein Gar1